MKVKLNLAQYEYLRINLESERKDLLKYFIDNSQDDKKFFEINEDVANEVRDWAGVRLQKIGFDENYELNSEGIILEELVDIFYS